VKIELNPDWSEFLQLLLSKRVKFLLVGGHAVAAHGEPRLTEDLDVFVELSRKNAENLRRALIEFGIGSAAPTVHELLEPGRIFMLGRKPRRIDILTDIDGVTFEECWKGRTEAEFKSTAVPVIGRTELIKNKRASGRAKDLADLTMLESMRPTRPVRKAHKSRPRATKTHKSSR
jgi:hypothetical protein